MLYFRWCQLVVHEEMNTTQPSIHIWLTTYCHPLGSEIVHVCVFESDMKTDQTLLLHEPLNLLIIYITLLLF